MSSSGSTTTSHLQKYPDQFIDKNEAKRALSDKSVTNSRYPRYDQIHFTAGDVDQFNQYRDLSNGEKELCEDGGVSLDDNFFKEIKAPDPNIWRGNSDLKGNATDNTFKYIFHKFKKGIYVKIQDNTLRVFLPFSKYSFTNEWSERIKLGNRYKSIDQMVRSISTLQGYRSPPPGAVTHSPLCKWYANNCLVRYENPINEGESNVGNLKNMLETLCAERQIPDIEFFLNRRDFPLLTRNHTEPYYHIWGEDHPLVSHRYDKYAPIMSMCSRDEYADLIIPTWEDWARVQSEQGIYFAGETANYSTQNLPPWEDRLPVAVFRGGSTGCGVTAETNARLRLVNMAADPLVNKVEPDYGYPYLDAGITKWNLRPRINKTNQKLESIDIADFPPLTSKLTLQQQAGYKYIIDIDGHVAAFRLSAELGTGSLILRVESPWKLWYSNFLLPGIHYVPVKADLSDLIEKIQWCRQHDDQAQQIAANARTFYETFLSRDGLLDYMQFLFVKTKEKMGYYLYNTLYPARIAREIQEDSLYGYMYEPQYKIDGDKLVSQNYNRFQILSILRSYGFLYGIRQIIKNLIVKSIFDNFITNETVVLNKTTQVKFFSFVKKLKIASKQSKDPEKAYQLAHQEFIGYLEVNALLRYIPNFSFIYGFDLSNGILYTEFVDGPTVQEWISRDTTSVSAYLFLLEQICLALHMAQVECGFIHNDLTPWNIIVKELGTKDKKIVRSFNYICYDTIYEVKTSVIPIFIDYGRSHVIHQGIHYGYHNKYYKVQDIFMFIVSSLTVFSQNRPDLKENEWQQLYSLVNFFAGSSPLSTPIRTPVDLNQFLCKTKNYSELLYGNKEGLEDRTPYALLGHIFTLQKSSTQKINRYTPFSRVDNSRQIFDYFFAIDNEQREISYYDFFVRLKHSTLPQPKNPLALYHTYDLLTQAVKGIDESYKKFLKDNLGDTLPDKKPNRSTIPRLVETTLKFLNRVYIRNIEKYSEPQKKERLDIDYTVYPLPNANIKELIQQVYQSEYYELDSLKSLEQFFLSINDNLSRSGLSSTAMMISLFSATTTLPEQLRDYYRKKVRPSLTKPSLDELVFRADRQTITWISSVIYNYNKTYLEEAENRCAYKTLRDSISELLGETEEITNLTNQVNGKIYGSN